MKPAQENDTRQVEFRLEGCARTKYKVAIGSTFLTNYQPISYARGVSLQLPEEKN